MKTRLWPVSAVGVGTAILLNALLLLSTHAEDAREGTNVVPLIYFDAVPVSDAIQNLARQADFNFILDANMPRSGGSVDGRWTNVTCRQVLDEVLKQNDFELVENPATTIARIAPKSSHAKPVPPAAVGETNGATAVTTPLIVLDEVPLEVAITQLAASAKLKVSVDPSVSNPINEDGAPMQVPPVSIRWKNVTFAPGARGVARCLRSGDEKGSCGIRLSDLGERRKPVRRNFKPREQLNGFA